MRPAALELATLRNRLAALGDVTCTDYFVRFTPREGKLSMSVFPDGRAMVHGTADPAAARSLYARYLGA
jgi:adenylyltransferase/sulfurtransferase